MKRIIKFGLRLLGHVPGFRRVWLGAARWILNNFAVPTRWRDLIMWEMGTYVLGEGYEEEVRLKTGPVILVGMEDLVNRLILFHPYHKNFIWEPQTLRLAMRIQERNGVTLIAGGHIGYHALHLAQAAVAKDGHVYVFEPVGKFYNRLVQGASRLGRHILSTEKAALDTKSCASAKIYLSDAQSSLSSLVAKTTEFEEVPCWSIDEFVARKNLSGVNLILLDVEGYELPILRGATSTLESGPDLILEVNLRDLAKQGKSPTELLDFLFEREYSVFVITDDYGFTLNSSHGHVVLMKQIARQHSVLPTDSEWFNILATRNVRKFRGAGILVEG
jgi:FkbM family methyltransferase